MIYQERYILTAHSQRREIDRDNVNPKEEILPNFTGFNHFPEVAVGGRDEPEIRFPGLAVPDRKVNAVVDCPQQLDLHIQAQFCDFIEKKSPLVGAVQVSGGIRVRAGKSAFLMPEEFTFKQMLGMAPQLTGTNSAARLRLSSWMPCATSSFPVPDSP